MMFELPSWAHRLLALVLLLLLIGLFAGTVVGPIWSLNAGYAERIDELTGQLRRFSGMAAQEARLRAHLNRLRTPGAGGSYYLAGSTASLAAAELQRLVKGAAAANQGVVLSTQVVPTPAAIGIERVVLRVQMRGDTDTMHRTFHALETGQPYLFLDNVRMRVLGGVLRRGIMAGAQQLDVHFDVTGYLMNRDANPGTS